MPPRVFDLPTGVGPPRWTYLFMVLVAGRVVHVGHSRNPYAYINRMAQAPHRYPTRPLARLLARRKDASCCTKIRVVGVVYDDPAVYSVYISRILEALCDECKNLLVPLGDFRKKLQPLSSDPSPTYTTVTTFDARLQEK